MRKGALSDLRTWFVYTSGIPLDISFMGDDDVCLFANGTLALDLGGIHTVVMDEKTIDDTNAASYGLVDGNLYEMMIFHAERQTSASTYKLTVSGITPQPSLCRLL